MNALTSKLDRAFRYLDQARPDDAIRQLRAFAHQINASRNAGILSDEQAKSLLEQTAMLMISIGLSADGMVGNALELAARDRVFADVAVMQELLSQF